MEEGTTLKLAGTKGQCVVYNICLRRFYMVYLDWL